MYLSSITRPETTESAPATRNAVAGNVWALGTVSLITDISSEMVTAILPLYLAAGVVSPIAFGALDGLYVGATAVLGLIGGYLADRLRRAKAVAGLGYGLSAAAKIGLLLAGSSVGALGLVLVGDRAGKGLRTAPRDALITASSRPADLGRAFGIHRTMDSIGAFLGPLVALAVLGSTGLTLIEGRVGQNFSAVFMTSFCVATAGVVVLMLFVRDPHADVPDAQQVSLRAAVGLARSLPIRRLVLVSVLLGLATIGDSFLYLLLQRRAQLATGWFPILAVGTATAYLLLATPIGVLADRWGRRRIVLLGYLVLGIAYAAVALPWGGMPLVAAVLILNGVFYAATDGVLMAVAGPLVTDSMRTTVFAMIRTGQALAYLVSSLLFGLAWQWRGPETACVAATAALALAMLLSARLLPGTKEIQE